MAIDLNCDIGELADVALEEALMRSVTSANVACGGHAGDAVTMERTVRLARQYGVAVGAHPGYPDRVNFGRVELPLSGAQIAGAVAGQVRALADIAGELTHVKPHGALYNLAAKDAGVARAIGEGVASIDRELVLVGLAGSAMLEVWREMGFRVAGEGFADRRYEPDGSLRSRKFADALISSPGQAAAQALRLAREGGAETICVHSDTPGSVRILAAVSEALRKAGITLKGLLRD
jgi:5-oxoprolinase (ATP-hydrolysing) subunit A